MAVTYPRQFDMYENRFETNDWIVVKDDRTYGLRTINVYFKDTHVAQTFIKEREGQISYNRFDRIKMLEGFESLRSEVEKVLYAASRKRYNQLLIEEKKKQELIKQAKVNTKFLGPF